MKKKILFSIQGQYYFDKAIQNIINLSKYYDIFVVIKETYSSVATHALARACIHDNLKPNAINKESDQ